MTLTIQEKMGMRRKDAPLWASSAAKDWCWIRNRRVAVVDRGGGIAETYLDDDDVWRTLLDSYRHQLEIQYKSVYKR